MEQPKIAIVTGIYPPIIGGAGAVMNSLALSAPEQICVITSKYDHVGHRLRFESEDDRQDHHVYRVNRLSHRMQMLPPGKIRAISQALYDKVIIHPRASRELEETLDRINPDVVCIGTLGSCFWVADVVRRRNRNTKIIFYIHGEEVPSGRGYHNAMNLRSLQRADGIVAVSSFTRNALIRAGVPPAKIEVISNGVDPARFTPGPKNKAILDRYGIGDRPVLLTLARLDERKGQDMVIRALPDIRNAVQDVAYLVAGDGEYAPVLRALAKELRVEDNVIFAGEVTADEVVEFYRSCDLYIMANRTTVSGDTEGFGLVFLEAGACERAVIGGNAGGVPDAIVHGVTGFLVNGQSPPDIAQSVCALLRDKDLREQLGRNGRSHALRNCWKSKTEQFLNCCSTVCIPELLG